MRLTLRTMLAYMDGLLDPQDAQDIGKRIEESEFASALYHKIRDVMRRLRLAAPGLAERGPGMDPNTVAEYLDNILSSDRVPDFEKVCLESEVHLAEVAACHQILAVVLGEAAEIDPESRKRMYQLPNVLSEAAEERLAVAAVASRLSGDGDAPGAADPKSGARPVMPADFPAPPAQRRLLPTVGWLLVAGVALGFVLLAAGQFEENSRLLQSVDWVRGRLAAVLSPKKAEPPPEKAEETPPAPQANSAVSPSPANDTPQEKPAVKEPAPAPAPVAKMDTRGPAPKTLPVEKTAPVAPPVKGPVPPPAKPDEVARNDLKPPLGPPAKPPAAEPGESTKPPPVPENPAPAEEAQPVARAMLTEHDLLLKFNRGDATWRRVGPDEVLMARQPLLALPTYRPRIAIGVNIELLGGTRAVPVAPEVPGGVPGIEVLYGRLVIKPQTQPGVQVRLVGGSHGGVLTLTSVESIAALEVHREHRPGTDPKTSPPAVTTMLYVARGAAVWEESGQPAARLSAPATLAIETPPETAAEAAGREMPRWIEPTPIRSAESLASDRMIKEFGTDKPAGLRLNELTEHQRMEIKWLAMRSLAHLGQFEPMVAALNDNDLRQELKRDWLDYVEQIRQGMARGPESAAAVRQVVENKFGRDAAAAYRMLWGYTDQDLAGGEDARLVDALGHEMLAMRVLAYCNLKDITGMAFCKPELDDTQRRLPLQRWQKVLEGHEIRYGGRGGQPSPAAEKPSSKSARPAPAP